MLMYDEVKALAEGRITCECGNSQWRQFIYLAVGKNQYIAACKSCARTLDFKDPKWIIKGGPCAAPSGEV